MKSISLCVALLALPASSVTDQENRKPVPTQVPIPQFSFATSQPSNIIFFILDDVGFDSLGQVATPNIDLLASGGVTYSRAYSHPWCKPSRDSLLLGTYGGRQRGESCNPSGSSALRPTKPTFVQTLQENGFLTGIVGKWHLGRSTSVGLPWWFAPHTLGFDHWWAGTATSAIGVCNPTGNTHDDGTFYASTQHRTIQQRDATLALISEAAINSKPLFAWVGFTAAHSPWVTPPPASILPVGYKLPFFPTEREIYEAEIVALDFVIGQIVAALPPDVWIVVMSENGTPVEVIEPASPNAKLTIFEGGIHVPLILSGPGLPPGALCDDPVQLYDLPNTLLSSLNFSGPMGDGRNILTAVPPDHFIYARHPGGDLRTVVESRYKLQENVGVLSLFDLLLDPRETTPLPLIGPDFDRLFATLQTLPNA